MKLMEIQVQSLLSQFKLIESSFSDLETFKLRDLVTQTVAEHMQKLDLESLKREFDEFNTRMHNLEAQMEAKMREINILYEEVEGGFQRNARDRSDYLVHYERIKDICQNQVNSFKETLEDYNERLGKLSYCILSVVNEDEAAQLRLHKGDMSPGDPQLPLEQVARVTATSQLRVNLPGIVGSGTSEVTAALEHELNHSGVPRRNEPQGSGRFKNINELASEINH